MTVADIETKVAELPESELADFIQWFEKFQAASEHQHTVQKKSLRLDKTRLALECAKLDPKEEQSLAEEGLADHSSDSRG